MKKVFGFAVIALMIGMSSCSETTICCDCSGTNGLYSGQEEVCHGDNLASQGTDPEDWRDWMEGSAVGCNCN